MEKSEDAKKIVWVDVVEEGHEPKNYEIQWLPDETVSDIMHITEPLNGSTRRYPSISRMATTYFRLGALRREGSGLLLVKIHPSKPSVM